MMINLLLQVHISPTYATTVDYNSPLSFMDSQPISATKEKIFQINNSDLTSYLLEKLSQHWFNMDHESTRDITQNSDFP